MRNIIKDVLVGVVVGCGVMAIKDKLPIVSGNVKSFLAKFRKKSLQQWVADGYK